VQFITDSNRTNLASFERACKNLTVFKHETSWSGCWWRQQAISHVWVFISVICFRSISWHIL